MWHIGSETSNTKGSAKVPGVEDRYLVAGSYDGTYVNIPNIQPLTYVQPFRIPHTLQLPPIPNNKCKPCSHQLTPLGGLLDASLVSRPIEVLHCIGDGMPHGSASQPTSWTLYLCAKL